MSSSDTPELDSLLEQKIKQLREFRQKQEGVWVIVSGAYLVSRSLIVALAKDDLLSPISAHRLMMWQTINGYLMESFFLLIDRRLDEGYALLRMAAEHTRDLVRIGDDQTKLEIWEKHKHGKKEKRLYQELFKFDESDKFEKHIYNLYNLATNYGVHGHQTTNLSSELHSTSPDGKIISLAVSDLGVYQSLIIWLTSFFPLQQLCLRTFEASFGNATSQAVASYQQMWKAFDETVEQIRQSVQEMQANEHNGLN